MEKVNMLKDNPLKANTLQVKALEVNMLKINTLKVSTLSQNAKCQHCTASLMAWKGSVVEVKDDWLALPCASAVSSQLPGQRWSAMMNRVRYASDRQDSGTHTRDGILCGVVREDVRSSSGRPRKAHLRASHSKTHVCTIPIKIRREYLHWNVHIHL